MPPVAEGLNFDYRLDNLSVRDIFMEQFVKTHECFT